jgi:inner membrane protein
MALPIDPPLLPHPGARRRSLFVKVAAIGCLLVLLHIPLVMTRGVLRDRQSYQMQATEEVSGVWGREQRVTGPLLAVPYTYRGIASRQKLVNGQWTTVEEPAMTSAVAYFLPDELTIDSVVEPDVRHRGIYDVVVYTTRLKMKGQVRADFVGEGIQAEHVDWERGRLVVGVSDLHGLRSIMPLRRADGSEAAFDVNEATLSQALALGANPAANGAAPVSFAIEAVVQGSGAVTMVPVGKTTTVHMRSPWPSASFMGAWLPVTRETAAAGFEADWNVAHFSRGFGQSWTTRSTPEADMMKKLAAAAFGVRLGRGIDSYSVVERAQKYGVLFFVLIFAVFFLFEVSADLRIHPLQYAMVGAALCLFFLGFLALSEFCSTAIAYGVAAGACTAMIGLYAWTFLKSGARTLVVCGGLGGTYAYLYFVLKSQDYALIAGTGALFAMLGLAMYVTRRINWYALDATPRGSAAA